MPNVTPIIIKNGIDLSEWTPITRSVDALSRVGWICDVNEKKGVELMVQAMAVLQEDDPQISVHQIGRNQDVRRWHYLDTILPQMNITWMTHGYENSHEFVKHFLGKVGWVLSSSIAEGCPMNVIEAMATGAVPLVHRWPGADHQFPEECLWGSLSEFRRKVEYLRNEKPSSIAQMARGWAEKMYDYRETYKPVLEVMESRLLQEV